MTGSSLATNPAAVGNASYSYTMRVEVPASRIVAAVTDAAEIMRWWTSVSGSERHGKDVRLKMGEQYLGFTVEQSSADEVTWTVTTCEMAPDWVGTVPSFSIRPNNDGTCDLEFRHVGLVPSLECYDMCRAGWGHFMPSLHQFLETGQGLPNEPRLQTA